MSSSCVSWPAAASNKALVQKILDFFETFRNTICMQIVLVTPGTKGSLKLKTKATKFQFAVFLIPKLSKGGRNQLLL